MRIRKYAAVWVPMAAFLAVAAVPVFGPIPFGLANNGDFVRVLAPLRLWPAPPFRDDPNVYFRYFVNDYVRSNRWDSRIPSSEWLVAALARLISRVVLSRRTFQLRMMGVVHLAMLGVALFIFLHALRRRAAWVRWICGFLLVFIWTDLEWVGEFNTAYSDAGAVMALAILFAIAVHQLLDEGSWRLPAGFAALSCFLLGTKLQHETALPFLAGFCIFAGLRARNRIGRIVWLATPVLLLGTTGWMILRTPQVYRAPPAFTIVFHKLALMAPDAKEVLDDFDMPQSEFLKYTGRFAFEPEVPITDPGFQRRILSLVTPATLVSFYWWHPAVTRKILISDLLQSGPDVNLSWSGYGHLRESDVRSGRRPFELTIWSRIRHDLYKVSPFHAVWLFGFVIAICGVCMFSTRVASWLPIWPVMLLMALLAVSSFVFASLTDAAETVRHLVFFQAAMDLTIVSLAVSIALGIEGWRKKN